MPKAPKRQNRTMPGLLFRPQELQNELLALQNIAEPFLNPNTVYVLKGIARNLEGLIANGGIDKLSIPQNTPLITRVSVGEFDRDSGRRVYGKISGVWRLNAIKVGKKNRPAKWIKFDGIASTKVQIVDCESDLEIACWSVDLGDDDAPGCYFHAHAGSFFPEFPVPRQPSLFVTPMAVIAFVLGELFQDSWERRLRSNDHHQNRWRSIQTERLKRLLEWKIRQLTTEQTSPWMSLKSATPNEDLFTS